MAIAKAKAKAPVTPGREAVADRGEDRAPPRDPNVIYNRLGEPIELGRILAQDDDKLNITKLGITPPEGWVYEWRTVSVKNVPAIDQIVDDDQNGWTPVPASRHDGRIMPKGYDGPIERTGLMLKERPLRAVQMARARDKHLAKQQLGDAHSMAGLLQRVAPNAANILDGNALEAQRGTFSRKVAEPENSGYLAGRQYARDGGNYTLDE